MFLRFIIMAGLGVAVAAQSVPANAIDTMVTSCKGDGNNRSEDFKGTMRVEAKNESNDQSWVVYKREFLVDGKVKNTNDTIVKLGTTRDKLMQEDLSYSSSGNTTNKIIVTFLDGPRRDTATKLECTFIVKGQKYTDEDNNTTYYQKARDVECASKNYVTCTRQYKSGQNRFEFKLTLGTP